MASAAPLRPIFPEFAPRVDPEYLAFYNENQANELGLHEIPWTPDLRLKPPQPGGSQPLKVGDVRDKQFEKFAVRIFTPEGERPKDGWPIIVYFHGGG
jgi:acetyl esterase/lipase